MRSSPTDIDTITEGKLVVNMYNTFKYNFINQGNIDQILTTKVEDRLKETAPQAQIHHPTSNPSSQLMKIVVIPDEPIAKKLAILYNEFVDLVASLKSTLRKAVNNRTLEIIDITDYISEYLRVKGWTNARDISELFEYLWPYYSYIDCGVLEAIINSKRFKLDKQLQEDTSSYKQHLEEFKESTTLTEFKKAVEKAFIPNPQVTSTTREVVIKINLHWGKKTLENFKTLVNYMFHQRMTHIRVEEGSICVTLIVPQSVVEYILKIAPLKKSLHQLLVSSN